MTPVSLVANMGWFVLSKGEQCLVLMMMMKKKKKMMMMMMMMMMIGSNRATNLLRRFPRDRMALPSTSFPIGWLWSFCVSSCSKGPGEVWPYFSRLQKIREDMKTDELFEVNPSKGCNYRLLDVFWVWATSSTALAPENSWEKHHNRMLWVSCFSFAFGTIWFLWLFVVMLTDECCY